MVIKRDEVKSVSILNAFIKVRELISTGIFQQRQIYKVLLAFGFIETEIEHIQHWILYLDIQSSVI